MIVCLCKGVSCSSVRRAVGDGASDVASVGRACGAGTDCGSCHAMIDEIVYEELSSRSGARHLPVVQAVPSAARDRDDDRAA